MQNTAQHARGKKDVEGLMMRSSARCWLSQGARNAVLYVLYVQRAVVWLLRSGGAFNVHSGNAGGAGGERLVLLRETVCTWRHAGDDGPGHRLAEHPYYALACAAGSGRAGGACKRSGLPGPDAALAMRAFARVVLGLDRIGDGACVLLVRRPADACLAHMPGRHSHGR